VYKSLITKSLQQKKKKQNKINGNGEEKRIDLEFIYAKRAVLA
jgi:hypothetical protein